jgi:hypothetical protein
MEEGRGEGEVQQLDARPLSGRVHAALGEIVGGVPKQSEVLSRLDRFGRNSHWQAAVSSEEIRRSQA